ncbi:hypothetical protein [Rhodococcoides kroppenstedtii]|uniref:hypothetical protein n=1 Tax=Rhodococcoides kroppenstedtii TaxID=293050 RepID=UPI001BDDCE9B|nr:hypothetical protein [Rhodococcus kroppenstedtii]MBT1191179.1 hypothetical protein [Rhodococcus kroppenstedtii]
MTPDMPTTDTPAPGRVLGLHVTDRAAVAVVLSSTTGEMVRVPVVTDGVLYLLPDGSSSLTRPDEPSPTVDVVDRFSDHLGDPAGVVSAHGAVLRAEDLLATVLLLLIDRALPDADIVAVAHPTTWSTEQTAALQDSLAFLSLSGVDLVPVTGAPAGTVDDHLAVALAAARTAAGLAPSPGPGVVESTDPAPESRRRRLPLVVGAAVATIAIAAAVAGAIVVASDRTVSTAVPVIADANPASPTTTTGPGVSRSAGPFPTVPAGAAVSAVDVAATVPEVAAPASPPAASAPVPSPSVVLPVVPVGPPPGPTVDPAPSDSPAPEPDPVTEPGDTDPSETEPGESDEETPGDDESPSDSPSPAPPTAG